MILQAEFAERCRFFWPCANATRDPEGGDIRKSKRGALGRTKETTDRDLKATGARKRECCHSLPALPPPSMPAHLRAIAMHVLAAHAGGSNTQVGCTATLKAHQAHTLLVGNTLFMTEPAEA